MMQAFLSGFGWLILYFICCVICVLLIRHFIKMPTELFRKILHFVLLFSLTVFVQVFETWWLAAIAAVIFAVVIYPILMFAEKIKGYSELLTERKHGEIKRSLLIVFGMFAAIISICWGWMGDIWLVFACVFAWGFGDAAAAVCAVTELYTRNGFDTITCPFAAAATIIPCVVLWGGVSL